MSRLIRVLVVAVVAVGVAAPSAAAVPVPDRGLGVALGAMWKTILETPTPDNPFAGGDPCVKLGVLVIAPISATGDDIACTVKPRTWILVAAFSAECSTLEGGTAFFGANAAELRECAVRVNSGITSVTATLDGRALALRRVTSPLQRLDLPADNIFGAAPGTGPPQQPYESVANGWVALLAPLTPGTHKIASIPTGVFPIGGNPPPAPVHGNITTINVKRRP